MKQRLLGVTLIELMITLAVAIVLLAIGIPAFQRMQANSQAVARASAYSTALNLARSEAVGRGVPAGVCGKAKKSLADTACGGSGSLTTACTRTADDANPWCNGLLVFVDTNGNAAYDDGTDEVIRSFEAVRGLEPAISASTESIWFNGRGQSLAMGASCIQIVQTGTTGQERCVRVSPSGQISTTRANCPSPCN
jgi:type IV fimbrial biogenesis protein FimT